jgi:hypothetical protein
MSSNGKGVKYDRNYIDCDFNFSPRWCATNIAAQQKLGLLSDRRIGADPLDYHHSPASRTDLNHALFVNIARRQNQALNRYPGLSEDQIRQAHGFAYGGAVIQGLGCLYPFGSKEFSNLVHYVLSGDFGRELLLESQDV